MTAMLVQGPTRRPVIHRQPGQPVWDHRPVMTKRPRPLVLWRRLHDSVADSLTVGGPGLRLA